MDELKLTVGSKGEELIMGLGCNAEITNRMHWANITFRMSLYLIRNVQKHAYLKEFQHY